MNFEDTFIFPKIIIKQHNSEHYVILNEKDNYDLEIDIAKTCGSNIVVCWESSTYPPLYDNLSGDNLYKQLIDEIIKSAKKVYDLESDEFAKVQSLINGKEKYYDVAPLINKLEKNFSRTITLFVESIAYLKNNIDILDKDDEKYKKLHKYFKDTIIKLNKLENLSKNKLKEIEILSKIEVNKNQYSLNEIMKNFAALTLICTIPTLIFSFYGMYIGEGLFINVELPTIWLIVSITTIILVAMLSFFGWLRPHKINDSKIKITYNCKNARFLYIIIAFIAIVIIVILFLNCFNFRYI